MDHDNSDIDSTVEWLSVEIPRPQRKQRPRVGVYLVITFAVALVLSTVALAVHRILKWTAPIDASVTTHGLGDTAALHAESARAFGSFDASVDPLLGLSPEQKLQRQSVEDFFDRLEQCATRAAEQEEGQSEVVPPEQAEEFADLVDFDRFIRRIELTGRAVRFSNIAKRQLQAEAKRTLAVQPYWNQITVAGIHVPSDDPHSRVVYAHTSDADGDNDTECRFVISQFGDSRRLCDWERLDLGIHASEEWSIYAYYGSGDALEGYGNWSTAITNADSLILSNEGEAAAQKIRLAESYFVPAELNDLRWVLTAYRWQALGESAEARRCFEMVSYPAEVPGVYYGLMNYFQGRDPKSALGYAKLYEQTVGPTPALCEAKANLFDTMHRADEATAEWKKLLRMEPQNQIALRAVLSSLPADEKESFRPYLKNIEDPVSTLVGLAEIVGWDDRPALLFLMAELEKMAPESAASFNLNGLAHKLNGNYEVAAESYRRAFEHETDEDVRNSYADSYIEMMDRLGRGIEAWQGVPDPQAAFENLAYGYDDALLSISHSEFTQIVDLYRQRYPDSLVGYYYAATLALDADRYDLAEKLAREGLSAAQRQTGSDDEPLQHLESLKALLATALYHLDRLPEAYDVGEDRKARFAQLGHLALRQQHFDQLRDLVAMHKNRDGDYPYLHYFQGELAAHEKRWDEACAELKVAVEGESNQWIPASRLQTVYVESGKWLQHYYDSEDKKSAFSALATSLISAEQWDDFEILVVEHTKVWPDDPQVSIQLAYAAWERKDYQSYIQYAGKVLELDGNNEVNSYERSNIQGQLLKAYLRTNEFGQARDFAKRIREEKFNSTYLAIVEAAVGNLVTAGVLAKEVAQEYGDIARLYAHEDVGHLFLSNALTDLNSEFPVETLNELAPVSIVLVAENPWELSARDIAAAAEKSGISLFGVVKSVESVRPETTSAFIIPLESGNLWIAIGTGEFNPDWEIQAENHPLAQTAAQCPYWLACGTAGWSDYHREQMQDELLGVIAGITVDNAKAMFVRDPTPWEQFKLYAANQQILAAWRATGKRTPAKNDGLEVFESYTNAMEPEDRRFQTSLREAVRENITRPENTIELTLNLAPAHGMCTVRLRVSDLIYKYGNPLFVGRLVDDCELVPALRHGLKLRVDPDAVESWQLNSDPIVVRVPAPN